MAKTVHRFKAGQSGSSQPVETVKVEKDGSEQQVVTTKGEKKGIFLKGADYLLSRLPFTKYKYQNWSRTKRIVIGYLLWLIVLPVIPLVILIIMWARDPQGFKKSPAFPILGAIIVAWFGLGLGYVNSQTPVDSTDGQVTNAAKANVANKTTSEATNGRSFNNCTDAFNVGVFNIASTDPSYQAKLDRDGDGTACEK